ncbi:hypothetical protein B0J13DRAFT_517127 [Dactylonectria estremocensis]|uniref:NmrA-like domain-containing protein n=1 Tax=Dactylonectria estremocensis TaxID=1079267 RepID=A0A9P9CXY3_9HYPO|nr:hypothetical protein B0J13DRAFT_517127 [Dactylonectria estremocensis]
MVIINNVAVIGAGGALGKPVLDALIVSGKFNVSVLTRPASESTYPSSVRVIPVDFKSLSSLTAALAGQDALVSTVGTDGLLGQTLIVDAAIAAGVKRILPSDFGSDLTNSKTAALPVFGYKVAVRKHIEDKVKSGATITYTYIVNGPFLDWGVAHNFIINWSHGKPSLYDGGERPFSTTSLATIGNAVVGVLSKYEETRNRSVYIHDVALTQKKLLEIVQRIKPATKFEPTTVPLVDVGKSAYEELANGDYSFAVMSKFLSLAVFGEGYGSLLEKTDNELLGLAEKSDAEVGEILKAVVN